MNYAYSFGPGGMFGFGFPLWVAPLILALSLWSIFWKGLALWHSARRKQHWWFIILLVVNTAGILEIIYLFLVLKLVWKDLWKKSDGM